MCELPSARQTPDCMDDAQLPDLHPKIDTELCEWVLMGVDPCEAGMSKVLRNMALELCQKLSVHPDPDNPYFFPSASTIRHIRDRENAKRRMHTDDMKSVELLMKNRPSDESVFFRRADEEGGLLLVHQTAYQRELLLTYGNSLVCMDTTHQTNDKNLPMLLICVVTNDGSGFPVAIFFVDEESPSKIADALNKIKEWNPEWKPTHFMVDKTVADKAVIDSVFGDLNTATLLCDFRRLQAHKSWVIKRDSDVLPGMREQLLTDLKNLAASDTEERYEHRLANLKSSQAWTTNPKLQGYLDREWLNCKHMWVACFRHAYHGGIDTNNHQQSMKAVLKGKFFKHLLDTRLDSLLRTYWEKVIPYYTEKYTRENYSDLRRALLTRSEPWPFWALGRPHNIVKLLLERVKNGSEGVIRAGPETSQYLVEKTLGTLENMLREDLRDRHPRAGKEGTSLLEYRDSLDESSRYYSTHIKAGTCTCPDVRLNRLVCKHMFMVIKQTDWEFSDLPLSLTGHSRNVLDANIPGIRTQLGFYRKQNQQRNASPTIPPATPSPNHSTPPPDIQPTVQWLVTSIQSQSAVKLTPACVFAAEREVSRKPEIQPKQQTGKVHHHAGYGTKILRPCATEEPENPPTIAAPRSASQRRPTDVPAPVAPVAPEGSTSQHQPTAPRVKPAKMGSLATISMGQSSREQQQQQQRVRQMQQGVHVEPSYGQLVTASPPTASPAADSMPQQERSSSASLTATPEHRTVSPETPTTSATQPAHVGSPAQLMQAVQSVWAGQAVQDVQSAARAKQALATPAVLQMPLVQALSALQPLHAAQALPATQAVQSLQAMPSAQSAQAVPVMQALQAVLAQQPFQVGVSRLPSPAELLASLTKAMGMVPADYLRQLQERHLLLSVPNVTSSLPLPATAAATTTTTTATTTSAATGCVAAAATTSIGAASASAMLQTLSRPLQDRNPAVPILSPPIQLQPVAMPWSSASLPVNPLPSGASVSLHHQSVPTVSASLNTGAPLKQHTPTPAAPSLHTITPLFNTGVPLQSPVLWDACSHPVQVMHTSAPLLNTSIPLQIAATVWPSTPIPSAFHQPVPQPPLRVGPPPAPPAAWEAPPAPQAPPMRVGQPLSLPVVWEPPTIQASSAKMVEQLSPSAAAAAASAAAAAATAHTSTSSSSAPSPSHQQQQLQQQAAFKLPGSISAIAAAIQNAKSKVLIWNTLSQTLKAGSNTHLPSTAISPHLPNAVVNTQMPNAPASATLGVSSGQAFSPRGHGLPTPEMFLPSTNLAALSTLTAAIAACTPSLPLAGRFQPQPPPQIFHQQPQAPVRFHQPQHTPTAFHQLQQANTVFLQQQQASTAFHAQQGSTASQQQQQQQQQASSLGLLLAGPYFNPGLAASGFNSASNPRLPGSLACDPPPSSSILLLRSPPLPLKRKTPEVLDLSASPHTARPRTGSNSGMMNL